MSILSSAVTAYPRLSRARELETVALFGDIWLTFMVNVGLI